MRYILESLRPEIHQYFVEPDQGGRPFSRDQRSQVYQRAKNIDAVMLPYQAAGMKAALNLMGLKGTQPRSPMPPMPETEVERLRVVMQLAGLLAQ